MKKVYYLGHCGSGTTAFFKLIELVKEEGNKMLFHIEDYDTDAMKNRIITLRATKRTNYETGKTFIDFRSTKEQYKFCFIRELEIEEGEEPKKSFITL